MESLERDVAGAEARIKDLDRQIAWSFAQLPAVSQKNFTQSQLDLRYDVLRNLYDNLLQTLNSVSISEAMTLADIRLVDPAMVPGKAVPAGPKRGTIRFMGVFLGLVAAIGMAFLLEHLDDTIKTPDDARAAGARLLGTVPRFRKGRRGALISARDRQDPVSEAYRIVRNNLRFVGESERPLKSLLVTSPLSSEGKTTTAANLGISVAWEGKRVLLVDSDLRRPALHRLFGLDNLSGLSDVLAGKAVAKEVIRATPVEGLFLMSAGSPASDPALLIESHDMRALASDLSLLYDLVIMDSPPALVAVDAITLARYADGTISILESGRESPAVVAHEKDLCGKANVSLLGIVLNKYRGNRGGCSYHYPSSYSRNRA